MSERLSWTKRLPLLLAALAALLLITPPTPAEPRLARQDALVARLVCLFVKQAHLNTPDLGNEVSKRLFRGFLNELDPYKLYFNKSDIDEFKKRETKLAEQLQDGDLTFAYTVYQRLVKRIAERQKLVEEFIEAKHDFTATEYLETDSATIEYAGTADEFRQRWRKRIKFDLLRHRVARKPVAEAEAKKKILARYRELLKRWKQVDNNELLEMYLSQLTTSIDPHSTYMSPTTLAEFEIALRLNLDGIGAVLRSANGESIIVEVVPGGAASQDGRLKPNDRIVGVAQDDGKFVDTADMKLSDVVKMIRGKRGTKVRLKVVPAGKIEPVVYELTRQKIELKSQAARGDIVEEGKNADGKPYRIGVINLPSFYFDPDKDKATRSATEDVRKLLKEFTARKVDGVVLDLRYNGGGSLNEALGLTGLFIDQGPVVQVKDPRRGVKSLDDPEKGTVYSGPLVVLTSRFSASASEILAGTLQDYGRALIVGDTSTHGKGTVQVMIDLGDQVRANTPPKLGALKLTIQQFYRVNGDSTQGRGVVSDVVLPSLTEALASGEKEQENALPFDKVKPVEHAKLGLVPAELKKALQKRSDQRVKESRDFAKLARDIGWLKQWKARKKVTLNEKELREQLKDEEEKATPKSDEPALGKFEKTYKFKRNFTNNEVLRITQDFLQGKKLLSSR
jgi:carboxyl-terminal processing protease